MPPAAKPISTYALYPGEHFEVRDADQPTEYVFNGVTRVAQVTGSLSANDRLQRVRLQAGPNLFSLAVTAKDLVGQFQAGAIAPVPVVTALHRWSEATGSYAPVNAGETVPAGAVLWLHAATNPVISVFGSYTVPAPHVVPAGGRYVAGPGLEAWTPVFPASLGVWAYSTADRSWQAQLPGSLLPVSELPQQFPPGQALYVISEEDVELTAPDPRLRIRYYHQDHLGSSAVMTDASGTLIEEQAFLPSGAPRHEYRPRSVGGHYAFTQKERDQESRLHYFEARYLTSALGRSATTDPKYASPDALSSSELGSFLVQP